jgi:hypothetical protein
VADLLDGEDRGRLRDFAATQQLTRPHLLGAGARIADQLRLALPGLGDEAMAAVLAYASSVASTHAQVTGCPHVRQVSLLLGAAAVDLANLELDPL